MSTQPPLEDRAREFVEQWVGAGRWYLIAKLRLIFADIDAAATESATEAARAERDALKEDLNRCAQELTEARGEVERMRERLAGAERLLRGIDRDTHILGRGHAWWADLEAFLAAPAAPVTPAEPSPEEKLRQEWDGFCANPEHEELCDRAGLDNGAECRPKPAPVTPKGEPRADEWPCLVFTDGFTCRHAECKPAVAPPSEARGAKIRNEGGGRAERSAPPSCRPTKLAA